MVRVFIERNALCEKEMNQKKKIFRVYVVEKRTVKGAHHEFSSKILFFGIKKQPTKQKHTQSIC